MENKNKFSKYFNIHECYKDVLDDKVFVKVLSIADRMFEREGEWFEDIRHYLEDYYGDLLSRLIVGKEIIDGFENYKDVDRSSFDLLDKAPILKEKGYKGMLKYRLSDDFLSDDKREYIRLLSELNEKLTDYDDWRLLFSNINNKDLFEFLKSLDINVGWNDSDDLKNEYEKKYVDDFSIDGKELKSYHLDKMKNDYLKKRLRDLFGELLREI